MLSKTTRHHVDVLLNRRLATVKQVYETSMAQRLASSSTDAPGGAFAHRYLIGSPEPARRHQSASFPARRAAMTSPLCRSGSKRASFCLSVSRGSPAAATRIAESCTETSTGCPTLNPTDLAMEDGIRTAKLLPHR